MFFCDKTISSVLQMSPIFVQEFEQVVLELNFVVFLRFVKMSSDVHRNFLVNLQALYFAVSTPGVDIRHTLPFLADSGSIPDLSVVVTINILLNFSSFPNEVHEKRTRNIFATTAQAAAGIAKKKSLPFLSQL